MKTFLQNAARIVALTTAASLGAAGSTLAQQASGQPVGVDHVGEFVYLVRVSNPAQQRGRLQLVRVADGAVLYEETNSRPAFGQRFNVGGLSDGQYAVVVTLGKNTHRYTLQLRTITQRTTDLSLASTARR